METPTQTTDHLTTNFDPVTYIEGVYEGFDPEDPVYAPTRFVAECLHEVYQKGEVTGDRFLDIGTGPVCHTIYGPSRWFKEMVLSDFSEANLAVLRDWKAGNVKYLESLFKYMIQLEGTGEDWVACNRRLADKVTAIVPCDLRKEDPLSETEVEGQTFDAIGMSLVPIAAALNTPDYKTNLQHYRRLLKPGGHIVLVDILGQSTYDVGKYRFRTYCAEKESLQALYREAGYQILSWKQFDGPFDVRFAQDDIKLFVMVARKI